MRKVDFRFQIFFTSEMSEKYTYANQLFKAKFQYKRKFFTRICKRTQENWLEFTYKSLFPGFCLFLDSKEGKLFIQSLNELFFALLLH